jgi:hypothetical protein
MTGAVYGVWAKYRLQIKGKKFPAKLNGILELEFCVLCFVFCVFLFLFFFVWSFIVVNDSIVGLSGKEKYLCL